MLSLTLQRQTAPITILCLGAHSDDIEIGCGGAILSLLEQYARAKVYWVVLSSDPQRAAEAKQSAGRFLERAHSKSIIIKEFANSFFPSIAGDIKKYFEQLKLDVNPDLIFTHYRNDLHQDHRLVSELTWNSFRNHLILEYEIPKYDGDFGSPNLFVHLDEATARKKVGLIMEGFPSQREKHWFDENTFLAVLRLRAMESLSPQKYAEGFYCRKAVLR
jgi:LmbE family N-acetylglucosaminyl deacetylase